MSIWCSIDGPLGPLVIPERDQYDMTDHPEHGSWLVDVATTWHDGVRLSLDHHPVVSAEVYLTPAEARTLIDRLTRAVGL